MAKKFKSFEERPNLEDDQGYIRNQKINRRSVASRNTIDRGDKYGTNRRT